MWLATKEAARRREQRDSEGPKMPPLSIRQNTLGGLDEAIQYGKLFDAHPDVQLGPDEDIEHHYNRLKAADREYREQDNPDRVRRDQARQEQKLRPLAPFKEENTQPEAPSWVTGPAKPENSASDLKGMPQRIPGWFTGDAMDAPPPGYDLPNSLPRRDPGQTVRPYQVPPRRPSMDEWISGLADKGIYLNPDGTRMTPQQLSAPLPERPRPPAPRGHDIWADLIDQPLAAGRHRAAKVVIAYVTRVLSADDWNYEDYVAKQNARHKMMEDDGWTFRESGGGNGWEKKVGDKTHRIISDNALNRDGGYDQGYTYYPPGGSAKFYTDLHDAVRHSRTGQTQAELSIKQKPNAIEDSSYHPERDERTRPMGQLRPPGEKGTYQTLSSWSDEA